MLKIYVTIDTDLEFETGQTGEAADKKQAWSRVSSLKNSFKRFDKLRGLAPVFTWFVRADNEFEGLFGNPFYLLDSLEGFWQAQLKKGDGLGWHPHIYNGLSPDVDENRVCKFLMEYLPQLKSRFPIVKTTRMGWGFCTNKVMAALNEMGLEMDSSAIPGRTESPLKDWSRTSNAPYHPANDDYQVPGSLRILEIPITTYPIKAPYDQTAKLRYLNLSYNVQLLRPCLSKAVAELNEIVLIVHPFELMPSTRTHGLITFALSNAVSVLQALIDECKSANKDYQFCTL